MADPKPWQRWGPYLAERAWGTVREDYSADGDAWRYLPFDHARSRAFRWNEDGLGGICDLRQRLCLAWMFWNGFDPHVKDRIFGLDGHEGNHAEDAKEYWWYPDALPSHAWLQFRYRYPVAAFPYDRLREENAARTHGDPEFELAQTGVFDHGWWDLTVSYAMHDPDDIGIRLTATLASDEPATLHALPTLWFRNTWSWEHEPSIPVLRLVDGGVDARCDRLGQMVLRGPGEGLMCGNETNTGRLFGTPGPSFPKDGINDHLVRGSPTVNLDGLGTKAALWNRVSVEPGATVELHWRLSPTGEPPDPAVFPVRRAEADAYHRALAPEHLDHDRRRVLRQALAGLVWSKQFYHYDVERWLDGDPTGPPPPPQRRSGRNHEWAHLNNADIIAMPDIWEYPWYAVWDLAFHAVVFAHIDPGFAKHQLLLMCREWYQHPNGQIPAYEWDFGDVNPPVHAWAALRVFEIDGSRDFEFLERVLHKLLLAFTWWVNRQDAEGNNVFEGGFLGMDNIGPFDRSSVSDDVRLEQADGTAWMAMFCLDMLEICLVLADHDETYQDLATKFFEHFAYIATAMETHGLWSEEDGFYYDVLHAGTARIPLRVRSMVGLLPLVAVTTLAQETLDHLTDFATRTDWFLRNKPRFREPIEHVRLRGHRQLRLLSVLSPERLQRVVAAILDEDEFLSPFGIRSLSARHRSRPFRVPIDGSVAEVGYEPGESQSGLFGGNSNWRGPVWFPVNHLVIEALRTHSDFFDEEFRVECPTGSGHLVTLAEVADELSERLIRLFLPAADGTVPALAADDGYGDGWRRHGLLTFHEFFHGDTGAGLGASHQTGWTALVADLLLRGTPHP